MLDARFDLYDQAFALLAFASGHRSFGAATPWRRHAVALRAALERDVVPPILNAHERPEDLVARDALSAEQRDHLLAV